MIRADKAAEMADRLELKGPHRALYVTTQGGVSRLGAGVGGALMAGYLAFLAHALWRAVAGASGIGWPV